MINCFIIAESTTVEALAVHIKALSLNLTGYANTLTECINGIMSIKPDIIYVDIACFKQNLAEFNLFRNTCFFVILSDKVEDAFDAFEFQAFDYLLKPINYFRFIKGIEKYTTLTMRSPVNPKDTLILDTFFVKIDANGVKEMMFRYADLVFVEAMQNYVILHIEDGKQYLSYNTMKEMDEYLPETLFTRVHKSYIINDTKITSIEGNTVCLNGKEKILIGNTYRKAFLEKRNKKMIKGHRKVVNTI